MIPLTTRGQLTISQDTFIFSCNLILETYCLFGCAWSTFKDSSSSRPFFSLLAALFQIIRTATSGGMA
ncbi:putative stress-associated endoplasmic reticulum protein 2 [Iris pallida]|uniref:Stress-associated endoplasmic reticulum protein 2 n=1 Tax=Iris pallida TaxID=29817 RepID=A0AAX6EDI9_IRIPA|nr:putative stress-associated endoplasmic reticulum protein 2 [Iris pallida]KAJ6811979.1 putative stress-associated endoplasmic reticulum protein 2 [Iris pallida]